MDFKGNRGHRSSLRRHWIRWAVIAGTFALFIPPYLDRSGREMLAALAVWALVATVVWLWDR